MGSDQLLGAFMLSAKRKLTGFHPMGGLLILETCEGIVALENEERPSYAPQCFWRF
jgi:hypothetical protein